MLRRLTGVCELAYDGAPEPLTGGFWAELVTFRLADAPPGWSGPLVARVMPDAAMAAKETVIQAEVADQGFDTPRVLASGGPADGVDGRAFMVMTMADGHPLLAGLDGVGARAGLPASDGPAGPAAGRACRGRRVVATVRARVCARVGPSG